MQRLPDSKNTDCQCDDLRPADLHCAWGCHETFRSDTAWLSHRRGSHARGTRHCLPRSAFASLGLHFDGRVWLRNGARSSRLSPRRHAAA